MPYRCVHCSKIYEDSAKEVAEGCECNSKFFFYIKEDKLKQIIENEENGPDLTTNEKKQMEEDVREIAGVQNEDTPVFLDFESVMVIKPGKYILDLQKLLSSDKPRVYRLEDGKYIVDFITKKKSS